MEQSRDVRDEINDYLKEKGISKARLAEVCTIDRTTISHTLNKRLPLSDKRLKLINEFLGTDFKMKKVESPELLPHEQLEQTKQSLKKKPLFKDEKEN